MAKLGRPMGTKKYTPQKLRKACDAYFASISYQKPVMRPEPMLNSDGTPKTDAYGHTAYKYVPVITADGNEAMETVWTEPPSLMSLYLYLGIDKSTFSRYATLDAADPDSEAFCEICARAKLRVEAYLIPRLEDKGAANGVKFNLQHNFGWKETKNLEVTEGAKREDDPSKALEGMTMAEKIAMLEAAGVDVEAWK